ncbi:unnamed protein product [Hymenolepis diminuta]|uniref:Uncharacterized protein n=1 Tax=Hymenolepis diminuta TaxID=6216 RepID=A0A564XW52_HYMDI|nr:unnamed protein product [Hymenolepis diminuta]
MYTFNEAGRRKYNVHICKKRSSKCWLLFGLVECITLPRLTKGISRSLEHSGKCERASDSVASKCDVHAEAFPTNQTSIFM